MEATKPPGLVQFLNTTVPDERNAHCVTWAINKLGKEHYEPAVKPLVRLLDFRRPQTEGERIVHGLSEDKFPAEEALELIGKSALPELLRAIEAGATPEASRENALNVWMEIFRQSDEHPKGIAELKQEETKVSDARAKARLRWAVEQAVGRCNPPEQAACREAAATGSR